MTGSRSFRIEVVGRRKLMRVLPIFLVAVVGLTLGGASTDCSAKGPDIELDEAEVFILHQEA